VCGRECAAHREEDDCDKCPECNGSGYIDLIGRLVANTPHAKDDELFYKNKATRDVLLNFSRAKGYNL
jgi:hypothetical protein